MRVQYTLSMTPFDGGDFIKTLSLESFPKNMRYIATSEEATNTRLFILLFLKEPKGWQKPNAALFLREFQIRTLPNSGMPRPLYRALAF